MDLLLARRVHGARRAPAQCRPGVIAVRYTDVALAFASRQKQRFGRVAVSRPLWETRDSRLRLREACCVEAIQNVAKHAKSSGATISLTEDDGIVRFTVEDDGVGFDPATVVRGAGLANISDRVSAVGGTVRIESVPGAGTCVTGELPASTR